MDEHYSKALLSKERAFLFLSIAIVITLLTGFPESLKVFVLGTAGTITGGATAVQPIELQDYFIGLVIFAALMVFLGYLVHALRTPKPQSWYPQIVDEEEFSVGVDKDMFLDNSLERVNKELKNLRAAKDEAPTKKAKKLTKVPNIEEIHLEHTLRKINAQLHGYKKTPLVLEAPQEKTEWDDHLEEVKQELAGVEAMKIKKAKVREEAPSTLDIALKYESKKLQEELKRSLSKTKKNAKQITVLEEPARKKKWDDHLEEVKQEIAGVEAMKIKKAKVREEAPSTLDIALKYESKKLQEELKRSLSKQKKAITVLKEPARKKRWNEYLENVNQELGSVDQMPLQKVKILTKIPLITKTSETLEQKRLARELQKLHQTLEEEQQKTPAYFVKRYLPSSREWQLAKIKKHIQRKGAVKDKGELAEVERRLAEIYREN